MELPLPSAQARQFPAAGEVEPIREPPELRVPVRAKAIRKLPVAPAPPPECPESVPGEFRAAGTPLGTARAQVFASEAVPSERSPPVPGFPAPLLESW